MSDCTVCRILREDLYFHPYKMVMVQAINDQDTVNQKTARFCWTFWITTLTKFSLQMKQIFFFVAMSILKTVATGQPRTLPRNIHQKPLHSQKGIVWCGVAFLGVISPYFFEDEAGRAVTVNSARYTEMLRTFLELELQRLGVENQTL